MEDWLGINQYELDPLGRLTKTIDYENRATEYTWDEMNRKTKIKYPDKSETTYEYDVMGRMNKVINSEDITTYEYNLTGRLIKETKPNNITTTYKYDNLKRMIEKTTYNTQSEQLINNKYEYDEVGNKTKITIQDKDKNLNSSEIICQETIYQYDKLNQLIQLEIPNETIEKYIYDALGNRIEKQLIDINNQQANKTVTYEYNQENQLKKLIGQETITGYQATEQLDFQYDKRGNLTQIREVDKIIAKYTYNAANKMIETINHQGITTTYQYDGLGRRTKQQTKDRQTNYIIDTATPYNDVIMTEIKTRQNIQKERITYGIGKISSQITEQGEETKQYFINNELGSPVKIINEQGQTQTTITYEVYGTPNIEEQVTEEIHQINNIGYTTYTQDKTTNLMYAGARYYMPELGRFTSKDTYKGIITQPQSQNNYIYVLNNPLKYVDPTGHWPKWADNAVDWVGDRVNDAGDAIRDTANNVTDWVKNNSDTFDKIGKVVGTVAEVAVGTLTVVGGVALIVGTGGLGAVVLGVAGVVFGANNVWNGYNDTRHIMNGDWDNVLQDNFLRDKVFEQAGGWIGGFFGGLIAGEEGKKVGIEIGSEIFGLIYYIADIWIGAKGTAEAINQLKISRMFRGDIIKVSTKVSTSDKMGVAFTKEIRKSAMTNSELWVTIIKDFIGYYYDAKGFIQDIPSLWKSDRVCE